MDKSATGVTQAEYARHRGVARPTIHRLYHGGSLVLHADRTIDVAASDAALAVSFDPTRGGKGGGGILTRAAQAEEVDPETPARGDTVTESKRLSAYYKAKTDEAEYRKRIGELGELAKMRSGAAEAFGALARALEQSRARLAPLLAAESDERAVYELMGKEQDAALSELADTLEALPERVNATQQ